MHITPTNNIQSNFKGQILTQGSWTPKMIQSFKNNPKIKELAQGPYNIIGKMSKKISIPHKGFIYKLSINVEKERPTLWESCCSIFKKNIPFNITQHHHSEDEIINAIDTRIIPSEIKHYFDMIK